ncbi:hypothetical protein MANES_01G123001v8 [Manihot esculenta]|uniref:Uncharacterized protein n=1 Tax=Manihot esculenta TaxID=3983 RepID=A0ACB7IDJ4_MANES|nr:hypothetical protein MANES_01G123001v8 [Manihot esculenta]
MLELELASAQVVPPLSSTEVNMELALISADQTKVVPAAIVDAYALWGSSKVAIVRMVVSPDRSSPAKDVGGSLKRKNPRLPQGTTTDVAGTAEKKRRLVKESDIVPSQKGTLSSSLPRRSFSGKGKGKENQFREAKEGLPTVVSFLSYQSRTFFCYLYCTCNYRKGICTF